MEKSQEHYDYEDEDDDYHCDSDEIKYGMMSKTGSWNWAMNAGKKLVVAGVVISSAPVLLPPLLVVSALGFAMSLPFGVGFAAFACTHKLMTNLLPPPPLTPPLPLPYYEDDDEEDLDPDQVKMSEEIENEIQSRIELVDDDDYEEDLDLDQVKMSEEIENEIQSRLELVDDVPEETSSYDPVINVDTDLEREDEEEDDDEGEINNTKLIDWCENEDNVVIGVEAEMSLQLKRGGGDGDGDVDDANKTSAAVVVDDAASRGEDKPKKELKEEKQYNGGLNRSNEEWEPEKIWEKINAIRVIVGFKAPRRTSYLEEVKALYLFTGIEPPPPPPPSSDQFAELDAKLTFLMSVIGLK